MCVCVGTGLISDDDGIELRAMLTQHISVNAVWSLACMISRFCVKAGSDYEVHVSGPVRQSVYISCTFHVHCMLSACSFHVHCV